MPDQSGGHENKKDPFRRMRERIEATQNPWEVLELLRPLPLPDRPQFLQRFLDLASRLPRAERDAVLLAGRYIFRYRVVTADAEIGK